MALVIPSKFEAILRRDNTMYAVVLEAINELGGIFSDNKLYFFEEYTDHGESHINKVLKTAEDIIEEDTFEILSAKDISILILAVLLHDLGMHTYYESYKKMIEGDYDNLLKEIKLLTGEGKSWRKIWEEYIEEFSKMSSKELDDIFGSTKVKENTRSYESKENLTGYQKMVIGEFIRRNHPRIAFEIALNGIIGGNGKIDFGKNIKNDFKKIAGIVAYSHGTEIRETFNYLKIIGGRGSWKRPYDVNIVFLMIVLRIADYFQFDDTRIERSLIKLKSFSSPISKIEHDKHLSIEFIKPDDEDPETLYVKANPQNSNIYNKLISLLKNIQQELDMSWAVQSEIYGKNQIKNQPKIRFRRIQSNLTEKEYISSLKYVADKFFFDVDKDLLKLLIFPLYGNNPTYAVRELIQNSVDACKEIEKLQSSYKSLIEVSIVNEGDSNYFVIKDNGKGMTANEIKNFYLKAGSSFRKSSEWKQLFTDNDGKSSIQRSGKFGVGVLAAFLLGDRIEVTSRSYKEEGGYFFSCNLESTQVELTHVDNLEIGTTIKVSMSKNTIEMINKIKYPVKWNHWFVFSKPDISYKYYGFEVYQKNIQDEIPQFENQTSKHWNSFKTQNFERISYSYFPPVKSDDPAIDSKIICNGIIIPTNYNFYTPELQKPYLSIIDHDGQLALSLNRNSLISVDNFEKDLLEDICKDYIAKILMYKIDVDNNNELILFSNHSIDHPSSILTVRESQLIFGKDGFCIRYNFLQKKLLNNFDFYKIETYKKRNQMKLNKSSFNKKSLYYLVPQDMNENFREMTNRRGIHKELLSRRMNLSIEETMLLSTLEREANSKIFYSTNKKTIYTNLLEFDLHQKMLEDLINNNVYSFENIDMVDSKEINYSGHVYDISDKKRIEFNEIVLQNFIKYFNEDPIIPYEITERKNKFSLAFNDLEQYMEKYQNANS